MRALSFGQYNLVTQDATTFTIDSADENALFPINNLKEHLTTKVFRSTIGKTELSFIVDTRGAFNIEMIMLKGNFQYGLGITSLNVKASWTSDFTGTGVQSYDVNLSHEHNIGYKVLPNTERYRFWQFNCESTGDFIELSNIYLGPKLTLENCPTTFEFGWASGEDDFSKKQENRYGQVFIDRVGSRSMLEGNIGYLLESDYFKMKSLFDYVNEQYPLWLLFCDEEKLVQEDRYIFSGNFFLDKRPKFKNDMAKRFNISLSLYEVI
jgi:hypothetical protein